MGLRKLKTKLLADDLVAEDKAFEDRMWDQAFQAALADGLLEDTGDRRNGQIVYRVKGATKH